MKCPNCGLVISQKRRRCSRCGTSLRTISSDTPTTPGQGAAQPNEPDGGSAAVPEWRKEITQKVRAYGERKKYLTTPPTPLKEEGPPEPRISLVPQAEEDPVIQSQVPVPADRKRKDPVFEEKRPPARHHPPPGPNAFQSPAAVNRSEIHADDYPGLVFPESDETADSTPPLLLARRSGAFVVDTILTFALSFAVLWFVSWLYDKDWEIFLGSVRMQSAGFFLLGHCLYYLYFYKTSRQTPAQVFFSLELRVPGLNSIPIGKILVRWFSMVFLNVFNLVPVFLGKKFLLLDLLSGTEIRSLR